MVFWLVGVGVMGGRGRNLNPIHRSSTTPELHPPPDELYTSQPVKGDISLAEADQGVGVVWVC